MNKVAAEYKAFLEKVNALTAKQRQQGIQPTPEQARTALDAIGQLSLPKVGVSRITDSSLRLIDREIPIRIYDYDPESTATKPVLVFFHGGGHMCGSIELYDGISRRLAQSSGHRVVSVEYRLAPEHPYPCGLEDCLAVVDHLSDVLEDVQADQENLILAGDSAGGALAVTVAWQRAYRISSLILIYPSLDYTFSTPSYERFASGYLLETEKIRWYFDQYFQHNENRKTASPLFFPDLDRMPRTLIIAAELDPLVDDGKMFCNQLKRADVACEYHQGAGLIHCFLNLEVLNPPVIQQTYEIIANFLKKS